MIKLENKLAKELITKLFNYFSVKNDDFINMYLDSAPFIAPFHLICFDKKPFPDIWRSYKKDVDVDILAIVNQLDGHEYLDIISNKLSKAVVQSSDQDKLYGVGNWETDSNIKHEVISFEKNELSEIVANYVAAETYFFPSDLSWVMVITSENISFVIGDKTMIAKIKKSFPDYDTYESNSLFS